MGHGDNFGSVCLALLPLSVTKSHGEPPWAQPMHRAVPGTGRCPLAGAEDAQGPPPCFAHRLHPKGFISKTVLPLWSFGPKSVPRAPEAQGGARRIFLRLLHLSLLLKIQGRTDAQAGMDGRAMLGTSPPCLQPGFAEWASL